MAELRADGSLQWRLSDIAEEELQFMVPRAAMARFGVRFNTECHVQLPGGDAFESELQYVVETQGGCISAHWPQMRDALRLRGGETVILRDGRSGGELLLHLRAEPRHEPLVRLRESQRTSSSDGLEPFARLSGRRSSCLPTSPRQSPQLLSITQKKI